MVNLSLDSKNCLDEWIIWWTRVTQGNRAIKRWFMHTFVRARPASSSISDLGLKRDETCVTLQCVDLSAYLLASATTSIPLRYNRTAPAALRRDRARDVGVFIDAVIRRGESWAFERPHLRGPRSSLRARSGRSAPRWQKAPVSCPCGSTPWTSRTG